MKRKINIFVSIAVLFICAFFVYAFSTLLDFFPWGNNSSYVIWEPLIIYFIIPLFILLGLVRIIILSTSNVFFNMLYFLIALMLYLPSHFGFDLESDSFGRWIGVISMLIAFILTIIDVIRLYKGLGTSQQECK